MGLKLTAATTQMKRLASRLSRHEGGQDLIEYALMVAMIAVAVAAIFPQSIAPNISAIFSKVNSSLGSANI
jgi:Flp pilus assembly pilin Flp